MSDGPALRAGVVGFGWMGRVHAAAYRRLRAHYPALGRDVDVVAVADEQPRALDDALDRLGPVRVTPDWRGLVADPAVDALSVTAPNALHREIAVAAARAGKHLWIEKPVGLTAADAAAVAGAVGRAGVGAAVGFNYRHAPAVARARALLAEGALGEVTTLRVRFLTDYAASPDGVLTWRFLRERGGSGVLGDLASHAVDLVRHLLGPAGEVTDVVATTGIAVPRRPLPEAGAAGGHYAVARPGAATGAVENPDWVAALLRTAGGATVTLEASRAAVGDQNAYGVEVSGTRGRLAWDFRRMGELETSGGDGVVNAPRLRRLTGPPDGEYGAFQPGAGIALGYDDLKVVEAAGFARSVAAAQGGPVPAGPSAATPADAVRSAEVLDAMEESAASSRWVHLAPPLIG